MSCVGVYLLFKGDSLKYHLGRKFSTRDQDNDVSSRSCAVIFKGAWWYGDCHHSNLNGLYLRGNHSSYADGVNWYHWTRLYYSLRFTEMKIKRFNVWTELYNIFPSFFLINIINIQHGHVFHYHQLRLTVLLIFVRVTIIFNANDKMYCELLLTIRCTLIILDENVTWRR